MTCGKGWFMLFQKTITDTITERPWARCWCVFECKGNKGCAYEAVRVLRFNNHYAMLISEVQEKILVPLKITSIFFLKHEFTVIALTETWLNDNDCDMCGLFGYKVIGRHRVSQIRGGVVVCIPMCLLERHQTFPVPLKISKQSLLILKREISKMPQIF